MLAFLFVLGCAAQPPEPEAPAQAPASTSRAGATKTQVVMLGTGTPVTDPTRSGPCVAVVVDGYSYLVDMGPGLVRRATSAHAKGIEALEPGRLTHVFVTHLHSDHTAGFPDLWLSPWVMGRTSALNLFGPPGLQNMADHVGAAWAEDVKIRSEGLENAEIQGAVLRVKENPVDGGIIFRDARVEVTAIVVPHGTWKHAYAYRFVTPDRTIVISGDTAKSEAVAKACNGCDVLVHEVFSARGLERVPPSDFKSYHSTFHTSTTELAELAELAQPKLLLLYHQLYMGDSDDGLVTAIQAEWDGEVVAATDLGVY